MSILESKQPRERERLLRIGEVVRRVREEFPDVSISKIRFLEDEGLLSPQRTRGGYRLFSEHDVERLVTFLESVYRDRSIGTGGLAPRHGC